MKIYKDQDVLSAARDRYKFIFNSNSVYEFGLYHV